MSQCWDYGISVVRGLSLEHANMTQVSVIRSFFLPYLTLTVHILPSPYYTALICTFDIHVYRLRSTYKGCHSFSFLSEMFAYIYHHIF